VIRCSMCNVIVNRLLERNILVMFRMCVNEIAFHVAIVEMKLFCL
jgi:hypothetical protein